MAHGYLREYDEKSDRGDDRDRWREEDRERGWRSSEWTGRDPESRRDDRNERNHNFMLGDRRSEYPGRGGWERSPRNFGSGQHDHYLSWRDKQMEALDRDYADYCREREQQFHSDFDAWRSRRGNNPGPLRTGMTQTGQSHDPSGTLELTNEATDNVEPKADPVDAATLGTNSRAGR